MWLQGMPVVASVLLYSFSAQSIFVLMYCSVLVTHSSLYLQLHLRLLSGIHHLFGSSTTVVARWCTLTLTQQDSNSITGMCIHQVVSRCKPNNAHLALAALEKKLSTEGWLLATYPEHLCADASLSYDARATGLNHLNCPEPGCLHVL